jgi:hypothetical protein
MNDRDFWLIFRAALKQMISAIDRRYGFGDWKGVDDAIQTERQDGTSQTQQSLANAESTQNRGAGASALDGT